MVLDFIGGAKPEKRTRFGKSKINNVNCSTICLKAENGAKAVIRAGQEVARGDILGESNGMPVYASIAGVFKGILEIEGAKYFVVMNNGENGEVCINEPETRALTQLTPDDIIESAKKFAIADTRSGLPLWKLLTAANGNCRRLVIDCTETDPASAVNYRLCIEQAKNIVGGAKVLLRASGALKCVFAAEYYRNAAFSALTEYATDEKLFTTAALNEKYPYGDRAIMYALYLKTLKRDQTALDEGVLIVSPETAAALYTAMVSGMPQLDRYICVCGDGIKKGGNLKLPRGITLHDIIEICGGLEKGGFLVENSLLSGQPIGGALSDGTSTLIAAKPKKKVRLQCVSCGKCADVCPMKLLPNEILTLDSGEVIENCIACGACEYICPSGIPLLRLIQKHKEEDKQ